MNRKKIITFLLITVAIVLTIVGYLVLPETLVMQITFSGEAGNTTPKLVGLGFEILLSVGGAIAYYESEENKYLFLAFIGLFTYLVVFWFNM